MLELMLKTDFPWRKLNKEQKEKIKLKKLKLIIRKK